MASGPVRLRADSDLSAYRRAGVRSPGDRGRRRIARSCGGDVPAEQVAPSQDRHVAPLGAFVAAASRGARTLPGRTAAEPAAIPELPHGRGGDAYGLPQ